MLVVVIVLGLARPEIEGDDEDDDDYGKSGVFRDRPRGRRRPRSAWRGHEIEDEDDDDWEKSGYLARPCSFNLATKRRANPRQKPFPIQRRHADTPSRRPVSP